MNESLRTLRDRNSISYSLFVKILAEGAVATLATRTGKLCTEECHGHIQSNSGKAALSASNKTLTIGPHGSATHATQLNNLLSFSNSNTGVFQALIAVGILAIACMIARTGGSKSNGLIPQDNPSDSWYRQCRRTYLILPLIAGFTT